MKAIIGIIFVVLGVIILIFGDRQFGQYGIVSKWLFNPPTTGKFGKKLVKWAIGIVLIYFGISFIVMNFRG